jgi:integrase
MANKRRGHGEGTISQRGDGRWQVRVNLGRGDNGRRQRKYAYTGTQAAAVRKLKELGGREADGDLLVTSTPMVGTYLNEWFATNRDEWKPKTRKCYRDAIDLHLTPAFSHLRLEQLTPRVVQRWLTQHKETHGARRRITLAHAVLRSSLSAAQKLQLVSKNVAKSVTVTKPISKPIGPFTLEQAAAFLAVARGHRLGALFSVALACGLRLGEACGLRWEDVDLTTGEVRIRQQLQLIGKTLEVQTLKTEKSRRTLSLPSVCLEMLRTHRTRQLEERLKVGGAWEDCGLVFVTGTRNRPVDKRGRAAHRRGGPLHPRNVTRTYHELLAAAGLPRNRFHDLRHSAASMLIAAGVELVDVSQLLGHSEIRVTADLYAHLQTQTAQKAAGVMDRLLGNKG